MHAIGQASVFEHKNRDDRTAMDWHAEGSTPAMLAKCHTTPIIMRAAGAPAVFSQLRLEEAGANLALTATTLHSRVTVIRRLPVFHDVALSSF